MKCPECGLIDASRVTDSRPYKWAIRRKRACLHCGFKWFTYEISAEKFEYLETRDKTGRRPFSVGECRNLVKFKEEGLTYREIGEKVARSSSAVRAEVNRLLNSGEYFDFVEELEETK
jgi:transcriptional regulator NrdR family protein